MTKHTHRALLRPTCMQIKTSLSRGSNNNSQLTLYIAKIWVEICKMQLIEFLH